MVGSLLRFLTTILSVVAHVALGAAVIADYTGSTQRVDAFYEGETETAIQIEGMATLGEAIETVRAIDEVAQEAREAIVPEQLEVKEQVEDVEDIGEVISARADQVAESETIEAVEPEPVETIEPPPIVQEAQEEKIHVQEQVALATVRKSRNLAARNKHLGMIASLIDKKVVNPRSRHTGTAVVRFSVDPSGQLLWSKILVSSGSKRLDRAALKTIDRAAPFPPFPEGSVTQAEVLKMKFNFSMKKKRRRTRR